MFVALRTGGEALVLAESMAVPDFKGMMAHVRNGELTFEVGAFPPPPSAGRVVLLLSEP